MNLPPKVVRQIERGEKTQHRVLVKAPAYVERAGPRGTVRTGDDSYYLSQPRKPELGQSLIVQTAREHEDEARRLPEVRVLITDLNPTPVTLGETTTEQAKLEGYESLHAFASAWMLRHDAAWPPQTEALCKECQGHKHYVNHAGETVECHHCDEVGTIEIPDPDALADVELILARFQRKHGHHLVHVITFELQTDVPRYLNKRAYLPPTTSPSEALELVEVLDPPRPDWRHRAEVRRREALRDRDGARLAGLRSEEERLVELKAMAREANVDITSDVRVIGRRLDAIQTKITNKTQRAA